MASRTLILLFYILAASVPALAGETATLTGTVADESGGVIADVTVTARNTATGYSRQIATTAAGLYTFLALPAGRYQLGIDQPGFNSFRRMGLEVAPDVTLHIDIVLAVGTHSEAVVVAEAATQVDTANTQMGEHISTAQATIIPVNGRSFTDLLALQPGVIPASSRQPNAVVMSGCTNTPPSGDLNPGNMSVSGQRETANGFQVNGASVQEDFNMGTAIVPNLDSISEFRVLTSNFDAEYGNFSGGQVLVVTKSGANELHGSGFEFLRDTHLDARNFFADERARYDRLQFGGTLGGPVRRDRTFFFADYQGTRMTQGVETGRIAVPSLLNRAGDLSDIATSLTGTVNGQYWADLLTKRLGYGVSPGERYYFDGCSNPSACVLPSAHIPQRAWSTPSRNLLGYIPLPTRADDIFSTSAYNQTLRDDKGAVRLDHNTRWGLLGAYYFFDDYSLDDPYPTAQGGANVPGFNALSVGRAQFATLSLTTTLNAAAINEFRLGYMRSANNIGQPVGGVGPTLASQGFVDASGKPGIVPLAPSIEGVENVSLNDLTFGVDITGVQRANNTWQVSDNYARTAGSHLFKFGVSAHINQVNIGPNAMYNGSFLFQGTETGSDFADYLLGIASSYAQGDSKHFYLRNKYAGAFAQDR